MPARQGTPWHSGLPPTYLPTHLPACLSAYLPTYLPTHLPTRMYWAASVAGLGAHRLPPHPSGRQSDSHACEAAAAAARPLCRGRRAWQAGGPRPVTLKQVEKPPRVVSCGEQHIPKHATQLLSLLWLTSRMQYGSVPLSTGWYTLVVTQALTRK